MRCHLICFGPHSKINHNSFTQMLANKKQIFVFLPHFQRGFRKCFYKTFNIYELSVCKHPVTNGNHCNEFHHTMLVSEACTQAMSLVSRCFEVYAQIWTQTAALAERCMLHFPLQAGQLWCPMCTWAWSGLSWKLCELAALGRAGEGLKSQPAWKTSNKGVEDGKSHKVTQASWKQGTDSWKKAFWQPAMFLIWPMTWHMEMFFTVFWNKKLLDYDFHFSRVLSTFPNFLS